VFRELVLQLGRVLRHTLTEAAAKAPDRIAVAGVIAELLSKEPAMATPAVEQQGWRACARLVDVKGFGAHAFRPRSRPTTPIGKK